MRVAGVGGWVGDLYACMWSGERGKSVQYAMCNM